MDRLEKFINENQDEMFFTGGITDDQIHHLEQELDLKFHKDMYNFLCKYGLLMGYGIEILGCGKNGISSMVKETKRYREFGLDKEFLVIRNSDEWIYCMNNNTGAISLWYRSKKNHNYKSAHLWDFILQELIEAKDEW